MTGGSGQIAWGLQVGSECCCVVPGTGAAVVVNDAELLKAAKHRLVELRIVGKPGLPVDFTPGGDLGVPDPLNVRAPEGDKVGVKARVVHIPVRPELLHRVVARVKALKINRDHPMTNRIKGDALPRRGVGISLL